MNIREERQQEAVEAYLASDRRSIINACPRFGKIKVAIEIMDRMDCHSVLILMPRKDIEKGWWEDFGKFNKRSITMEFLTFASAKKIKPTAPEDYSLVIIDEPHELSLNQQQTLKEKLGNWPILGLTGTMTDKTREELFDSLNLDTCYKYDISQGVEDGILADYTLYIHKVELEKDEREKFHKMDYALIMTSDGLRRHFISLKMINLIQNSNAKRNETMRLIHQNRSERILVFCGVTAVADNLQIPVYHSKAREKFVFDEFCAGRGKHLATIKMMQAGVTITPINRGIINYMNGNPEDSAQKICRFLGFEYDNPDKKAIIHIVSSDEPFELVRMKTGLRFFDQSKIIYV